jgi:hypothetical protein
MAITTALATASKRLTQGMGEWMKTGYNIIVALTAFANGHTHTGSPDGTVLPVGALTDASITPAKLATAARTRSVQYHWITSSTAGNVTTPIFYAANTGVVSSAYFCSNANIIGGSADNNTLEILQYTGGTTLVGTVCSVNSGTSGTLGAGTPLSWGSIIAGTVLAGNWLFARKSTNAGGTVIADAIVAFTWTPS